MRDMIIQKIYESINWSISKRIFQT
jgi:hypothetical protein